MNAGDGVGPMEVTSWFSSDSVRCISWLNFFIAQNAETSLIIHNRLPGKFEYDQV